MKGIVKSGLGKGAHYIGLDNYKNQIIEKLNFTPFLGTLNIKNGDKSDFIKKIKKIVLKGNDKGCDCDCYPIKISANQKISDGAIIIPKLTSHGKDITEIISPDYLRKKLNLQDGDEVILYET